MSRLTKEDSASIWQCEFCGFINEFIPADYDIPKTEEVTYILENVTKKRNSCQDASVVFCLDISGSMCVTQPVES